VESNPDVKYQELAPRLAEIVRERARLAERYAATVKTLG
jgi:hypothetical protein